MVFNGIDETVVFSFIIDEADVFSFVIDELSVLSRLENKFGDSISLSSSSRSGITYERVAISTINRN
jgi:hypothetical protein